MVAMNPLQRFGLLLTPHFTTAGTYEYLMMQTSVRCMPGGVDGILVGMEYRLLGGSGLKVPVLSFGCATFGGQGVQFKAMSNTTVTEAKRMVSLCIDHGANLFDTADMYSYGKSEEFLGACIKGRRDAVLISTKCTQRMSEGPNNIGSSRSHLRDSLEGSLRRLGTDYVDIYHMHAFDAQTPVEETLSTLDDFVREGKVRYIAASNFSGWHMMKSLAASEKHGWSRYVGHQVYYSLVGRDYEWELMPLAVDQKIGALVWSPLGWGRLTGKLRRGQPKPKVSRLPVTSDVGPLVPEEYLYTVVDALDAVAVETGKSVSQIALNWLLGRPSIATVIIGARDEKQLKQNLGAIGWQLSAEQIEKLDRASQLPRPYPYWHQDQFERNPAPAKLY
jgi:aryl-alcohol dehydrogenase-like predicted oxidoreductase